MTSVIHAIGRKCRAEAAVAQLEGGEAGSVRERFAAGATGRLCLTKSEICHTCSP